MKNTVKFLSIFILFSCSPSEEELKIAVDEIYNQVKTIPSSKPCENLDGYKNLEAYESRYKSNFYSELTSQKIKLYEEECSKKIIADEKEKQRKAELRKLGSWSTGNYVDEFGDNTGEGFIRLTTYGYFSNSATTDSRLRVVMMLSDGKIDKPWFRFYEYDGKNVPVVIDWGNHDLSVLISLIGTSPNKLIFKKIKESFDYEGEASLWEMEGFFDKNIYSHSLLGNIKTKSRKIGVIGKKGMLVMDDGLKNLSFYKNWFDKSFPDSKGELINIPNYKEPLANSLDLFFDLIRSEKKSHWSLELGVEISRLFEESILIDL